MAPKPQWHQTRWPGSNVQGMIHNVEWCTTQRTRGRSVACLSPSLLSAPMCVPCITLTLMQGSAVLNTTNNELVLSTDDMPLDANFTTSLHTLAMYVRTYAVCVCGVNTLSLPLHTTTFCSNSMWHTHRRGNEPVRYADGFFALHVAKVWPV